MKREELIDLLADRIATFEGFYKAESLAFKNNNPGNIRRWGLNPIVKGYVKFSTKVAGWAALKRQIHLNIQRKLTFKEFFAGKPGVYAGYAPSGDNNHPENYAKYVAKPFKVSIDTEISTLITDN